MTLVTFTAVLWNLSGSFVLPIFGGIAIPGYMMWAAIALCARRLLATYMIGRPLVRRQLRPGALQRRLPLPHDAHPRERRKHRALSRRAGRGAAPALGASRASTRPGGSLMTYNKRLTWLTSFYGQAASIFPYHRRRAAVFRRQDPARRADADGRRLRPGAGLAVLVRRYLSQARRLEGGRRPADHLRRGDGKAKQAAQRETGFEVARAAQRRARPARTSTCGCRTARCCSRMSTSRCARASPPSLRGPSGSGKTTLFRVLAGPVAVRPRPDRACRRTRACCSCRRSPICRSARCKRGAVLSGAARPLHRRGLPRGAGGLQARASACRGSARPTNWSLVLSGGEQQRLAFARALLYRPNWLFLDEATSALDEPTERRMYELLRRAPARRDRDQRRAPADGRGVPRAPAGHRSGAPSRRRQRRSRVKRERVVVFSSEPEPHEWMFSAAVERHPASRCALHPQWARATAHQLG